MNVFCRNWVCWCTKLSSKFNPVLRFFFITFSLLCLLPLHSFFHLQQISCCVFVHLLPSPHFLFHHHPPPPHTSTTYAITLIILLFSFFLPRSTHSSSVCVATSTHRSAVISYGLQSKPKGREIKDLRCSQRPPRSKGGYTTRLSRTHTG